MTREEREKAIKVLNNMKVKIIIPKATVIQNDKNWALDCAIQALEQEHSKKDIYLQGYSDAMREHKLFIQNVKEYMDNYNYAKAMEDYRA